MNPLVQKMLGTLARGGLMLTVGAYFIGKLIWTEEQATTYITEFVAVAIPAGLGLYNAWSSQRTQNTTLAVMNRLTGDKVDNVTAKDIADVIKSGDAAPVMTPADKAPKLNGTGDGIRLIQSIKGTGDGQ